MHNILSYVKFRKDISFLQMPINDADMLAFSCLSYLDYTGLVDGKTPIAEVAKKYKARKLKDDPDYKFDTKELLLLEMSDSKRYGKVCVADYEKEISEELEMTYYACTFYLNRFEAIVAFPGTDDSLLSWKENFVYLYKIPAPGQEKCREYLDKVLRQPFIKVRLIGHSKGGTLAAYAAMNTEQKLQKKIKDIYLLDAPGFSYDANKKAGFVAIKDRIRSYVPEDCVVGKLFKIPYGKPIVVKSFKEKFDQHELTHWNTTASGIEKTEATSEFSDKNAGVINNLVESVHPDKRQIAVDELFNMLFKNKITRIEELNNITFVNGVKLVLSYPKLSADTKNLLTTLLKEMKQ